MDVDSDDNLAANESDSSKHDSETAFASFQGLLSKKRGKGKAPGAYKKKVEEVGPSGQTWTPLEKQVYSAQVTHRLGIHYFYLGSEIEER